jgi:hypothetical protein
MQLGPERNKHGSKWYEEVAELEGKTKDIKFINR